MKQNYAHIAILLDRSGSMQSIATDVIGGFNKFLEDQKQLTGEATLTLVQFDDEYEILYNKSKLNDIKELTSKTFVPRGTTALNDSIGKLIVTTGEELAKLSEDERPDRVVFLIITDGYENASHEYTGEKIKEMVKHQETNYKWQFVFIGTDIDSMSEGNSRGMINTASFSKTSKGTRAVFRSMSANTSSYRNKSAVHGQSVTFDNLDIKEDEEDKK